jgi:hypothetical protein
MPNPYPKRLGILGLHTLTALPFLTIPPAVADPIYLTCRGTSYMSSINREVAATASVMIDLGKHLFAWTEDPSSYKFNSCTPPDPTPGPLDCTDVQASDLEYNFDILVGRPLSTGYAGSSSGGKIDRITGALEAEEAFWSGGKGKSIIEHRTWSMQCAPGAPKF